MKLKDFVNLCRICLDPSTKNPKTSVFSVNDKNNNVTIAEKIMLCGNMEIIEKLPYLSYKICDNCLNLLDCAYKFRELCKRSDKIIGKLRVKEKPVTTNTDKICDFSSFNELEKPIPYTKVKKLIKKVGSKTNNKGKNTDPLSVKAKKDAKQLINLQEIQNFKNNKVASNPRKIVLLNDFFEEDSTEIIETDIDDKNNIIIESLKLLKEEENLSQIKEDYSNVSIKQEDTSDLIPAACVCELCGKVYKKKSQMSLHMKVHLGKKDFECEICGKQFFSSSSMLRHLKKHSGIRPFKCSYCHRRFFEKKSKKVHERTHTGERPYQCEICGKSFTYSQSVTKHMIVHSQIKLYKCITCNKSFGTKYHLKQHQLTISHKNAENNKINNESSIKNENPVQSVVRNQ